MKLRTAALFLFPLLLLVACSKSNEEPPKLFKDQVQALDKAKTVDATVKRQAEDTQKATEEQTK